jgi:uncharacterized surface protein with fasciclin (FAS1) repeats
MRLVRITALSTVAAAAIVVGFGTVHPSLAQMKNDGMMSDKPVTVGGAPMYGSRNIIQNAVNSKEHTTLVAAVKAAGLVDTLQGSGPFTVFAPTNNAFEKLPKGTVETLLKPENKGKTHRRVDLSRRGRPAQRQRSDGSGEEGRRPAQDQDRAG